MKDKTYIHVKIRDSLHQELKKEAEQKGISLNAYINLILSERNK